MVTIPKLFHFAVIFLLLGLYGCSSALSEKPMPDIGIDSEDINTQFTVKAPPDMNNFRTDDSVQVIVDVKPDNVIEFPPDFGARMFVWENDEWVELENLYMMYPSDTVRIPTSSLEHGTTSVFPKIADQNK